MHHLPMGTVTLLFTDIEGSTRLVQQLGNRYADVLMKYRQVLRSACQRWNGRQAINAPIPPLERAPHERAVSAIRTQLGEETFAAAWAEGRSMTTDQALAAQG